jgi:hypothetical protein
MEFAPIASAMLKKRKLIVREAWQVGRHDVEIAGIKPDDDVIIPTGQADVPVLEVLRWKEERKGRRRSPKKRRKKRRR